MLFVVVHIVNCIHSTLDVAKHERKKTNSMQCNDAVWDTKIAAAVLVFNVSYNTTTTTITRARSENLKKL